MLQFFFFFLSCQVLLSQNSILSAHSKRINFIAVGPYSQILSLHFMVKIPIFNTTYDDSLGGSKDSHRKRPSSLCDVKTDTKRPRIFISPTGMIEHQLIKNNNIFVITMIY